MLMKYYIVTKNDCIKSPKNIYKIMLSKKSTQNYIYRDYNGITIPNVCSLVRDDEEIKILLHKNDIVMDDIFELFINSFPEFFINKNIISQC